MTYNDWYTIKSNQTQPKENNDYIFISSYVDIAQRKILLSFLGKF